MVLLITACGTGTQSGASGVDGMITDRPWVLRQYLESKGEKIRPLTSVDLPYHLDPEHIEISDDKVEGGKDSAY
jgi:glycerophosphoryl diester phosphodiesterase